MSLQDKFTYPLQLSTVSVPLALISCNVLLNWVYRNPMLLVCSTTVTIALIAVVHYLLDIYYAGWVPQTYKGYRTPPGPEFRPIVGQFITHFLQPNLHEMLKDEREKYGNVHSVQFGQTAGYMVHTRDLTKQLFDDAKNSKVVLRTDFQDTRYAFGRDKDILISNLEPWKVNRKGFTIAMAAVHKAMGGHLAYLSKIAEEEAISVRMRVSGGKPFVVSEEFIETTFNILVRTLVGRLATPEEKAVIVQLQSEFPRPCLAEIFHKIPECIIDKLFDNRHQQVKVMVDSINAILDDWIAQPTGKQCLIALLKEDDTIEEISLRGMVMNMFVAGYDSVKYHMTWYLHLITMYPKVQQRLQYLLYHDEKEYLVYFNQVYREVMRYRPIMLSGIWYKTTEDVILNDKDQKYIIPAKSYAFYNTYQIHHNTEFWDDPEKFRPSRFKKDGGVSDEDYAVNYVGFFLGKRRCLGEKMAVDEIKTVITELLRHHSFVSDIPLNDDTFVQTIMAQKPFHLRAVEKNIVDTLCSIEEADQ